MCNEKENGEREAHVVDFIAALLEGKTPECPKGGKCALFANGATPFTVDEINFLALGVRATKLKSELARYQPGK